MGAAFFRYCPIASGTGSEQSERRWRGATTFFAAYAAALFNAALATAQPAAIVIADDLGGDLLAYVQGWENIAALERPVEIDGFCISACTLVLGLVPPDRVCVTERAQFGFHSVSVNYHGHTAEGTRHLWSFYPPHVQELLRGKGWDGGAGHRSAGTFLIDATTFFPLCEEPRPVNVHFAY